jgi:hypothetical protein
MGTRSSGIEHLAMRLLALEPPHPGFANVEMDHALQAFAKIRAPLVKLAGTAGFTTLLARAVALASKRDPSLMHLRVENDGSLTGLDQLPRALNGNALKHHGGAIILTELLGLLISFVGESLTLTLVREAWPDAELDWNTNTEEKL